MDNMIFQLMRLKAKGFCCAQIISRGSAWIFS